MLVFVLQLDVNATLLVKFYLEFSLRRVNSQEFNIGIVDVNFESGDLILRNSDIVKVPKQFSLFSLRQVVYNMLNSIVTDLSQHHI